MGPLPPNMLDYLLKNVSSSVVCALFYFMSHVPLLLPVHIQGWCQELSDKGLTLLTRGLKHGFQGTICVKNLQKAAFHLPLRS